MRSVLAAGVLAGWALPAVAPVAPRLAGALRISRTIAAGVAVTFDDGPHPQGTPAVLEVLARHGVTATFFMVGEQVLKAPALAREVVEAGHTVGIHGQRHRNLLRLPPSLIARDLDEAYAVIADTTQRAPTLHRAPYGIYSWPALKAVRDRGWTPWLWSRWGRDWTRRATPRSIIATVGDPLGGDVVLLHDADDYSAPGSWRRTVAALPFVLESIAASGLPCVSLEGR
jgi:peptidoglycan/xylan/chitin deacetylase (PgdA/CDA1 family)